MTPTRFQFASDEFVYPLKITQISVKDKTEALYVQAPEKMDLAGDWSYQLTWVPMIQAATGCTPGACRGGEEGSSGWATCPALLQRAGTWVSLHAGAASTPNAKGMSDDHGMGTQAGATDIKILKGAPYSEAVPNVDEGFTAADLVNPKRAAAVRNVIQARLAQSGKYHPHGYAVRRVPAPDVKGLTQLAGHLEHGQFITKFRKVFCRDEMNEDLVLVPAKEGEETDRSEYQEVLPSSPP